MPTTDLDAPLVAPAGVEVIAAPSPFSTKHIRLLVGERATLAEIVAQAGVPAGYPARVFLERDGRLYGPIPAHQWPHIRPRRGTRVTIRAIPSGGGGGNDSNKTTRLILQIVVLLVVIVLIVLLPWLAPVWVILGSIAITAINLLLPPQQPKLPTLANLAGAAGRPAESPTFSITGSQNRANPYGPIPRVYGQHRLFPPFGAMPFTESLGNDQYLRELFVIGYGPLEITDLKIGDTPVAQFQNVEVEVRQGYPSDLPLTLYTNDVGELPLSVVLTAAGGPQARVTSQPATSLSVDITFPSGLVEFATTGGEWPLEVQVAVEYRRLGDVAWLVAPGSPLAVTDTRTTQIRAGLAWTPGGDEAVYEVRLTRLTEDRNDVLKHDQTVWSALRAIRAAPPIQMAGLAQVALRIKATDQLNGIIDQFNCIATAILPDWDAGTQTWITRATRNPAAAYRNVLQGVANPRAVADTRLNLPSLQQWAEHCTAKGFTFNQVIDFRQTVYQQLQDIAGAARAAPAFIDGRFGVVEDIEQSSPVQHFTPRNSWNFQGSRAFLSPLHALKVQFINPDADWQIDERIVYADGYDETTATLFEQLPTLGVTDPDQAWRIGRYHLAVLKLRPEVFTFNTDFENLICTRGDRIQLAHDVLLVGLAAGRIKTVQTLDGSLTGLVVDNECPMATGKSYGVRVRGQDGQSAVLTLVTVEGAQTTLVLTTAWNGTPTPQPGDLFLFGEAGLESMPCIVKEITHDRDLVAKLTVLPYDPAIYQADEGAIPPYQSFITHPPLLARTPPVPIIEAVRSDETVLSRGLDGTLTPRIVLTVRYLANAQIQADWVEVQYRRSDSSSRFLALPHAPPNAPEISVLPVEQGVSYDLRIRSVSSRGATSVWVTALAHRVVGKNSPPPDPAGLVLIGQTLSWAYSVPPADFAGFVIRRVSGVVARWEEGLLLHGGLVTATTSFTLPPMSGVWTLMVKAEDTTGNASAGMATLTQDFGDPLLHNIVETRDEHAQGFPGTKEQAAVSGITGDLEADQVPAGFWASNGAALFWTDPAALFWTSPYEQLRYTWTYVTGAQAAATTLLIEPGTQGVTTVEYKESASPDWLAFPGAVSGIQALTSYDLRVTIAAGAVQGIIQTLVIYLDAPDLTEHFDDLAIAGAGTRLPLVNSYRTIKSVSATVQAFGAETAITARVQDKSATLGPLIETLDAGGVAVDGHADVSLVGF